MLQCGCYNAMYTANPNPSHREKPVFITGNPVLITGILFSLQRFPCKTLCGIAVYTNANFVSVFLMKT